MTVDTDTRALALLAMLQDREQQAAECAGGAYENEDVPAPADPDEAENYGAATAWGEAAKLLRDTFTMRSPSIEGDAFDLASVIMGLLGELANLEGAGSDMHDAALNCRALLASFGPEPGSPNELLECASQAVERALDTGSAAASSLRCNFTTQNPDLYLVAQQLRQGAEVIR